MERATNILAESSNAAVLSSISLLQLEAITSVLGGEGGYHLKAFYMVADLLDDVEPYERKKPNAHRIATIQRLGDLWKDGANAPFLKWPNEFSLHVLILLDIPEKDRDQMFDKRGLRDVDVNKQWKKSRWTPLHLAAQTKNLSVVKRLIGMGAHSHRPDLHGHLPGYYVDSGTHPEIHSLLQPSSIKSSP